MPPEGGILLSENRTPDNHVKIGAADFTTANQLSMGYELSAMPVNPLLGRNLYEAGCALCVLW